MSSHNSSYWESWAQCRCALEQRVAHSPLFAIPLHVLDWADARGVTSRLYAWLSHEWLVVSNRRWDIERADKFVVIPKPGSVEIRLYRDACLVRKADVTPAGLDEELDHLISGFRQAADL